MKGLSEKVVAGGFTLALLVLSGVGAGSYLSAQKLISSRQWVEHTFEVLEALNKAVEGNMAAASGRYGYVTNHEKLYLKDYKSGLQTAEQGISDVQRLTIDNPAQQRRLTELKQLIAERNVLLQRSIDLIQQGRSTENTQTTLSNQSWRLNREIRLKLDAMKDEERHLLQQRKAATDASTEQAILINGVGYLLGFSLLIGVFWLLQRQIRIRQQAEATLQKHSEAISDLYNHAPCGYHSLDAAGIFTRINDTELEWLGYTRDEMVDKKTFAEVISAQSALLFQKNFPIFKAQGWVSDIEFEMVCKDGTLLPVSLSATAIKDTEGNFVMSRSTLFDISDRKRAQAALQKANEQLEAKVQERTAELSQVNALLRNELIDRKQAEQALSQSEQQLRLITDALPVLISYIDADQYYRFNNGAYEHWFGYERTTLYGKHVREVMGEAAYQTIEPYIEAVLSGEKVNYEGPVPYKDGGKRWVSAIYVPDFGEQGVVKGCFSLVSDITDRKQTAEELHESRQRLTFTLQTAEMGDWDLNLIDRSARRSLRHDQIFGYESFQNEWTYEKFLNHVLPEDRVAVDAKFGAALEKVELWDFECRIRRIDSEIRWIWARGHLYQNAEGQTVRMLGLVADITERKQAELALQQAKDGLEIQVQERTAALKQSNDDLRRSNHELEQFAYVASHDLQEPLRAVMGYTQLLTQDYSDRLDKTAQGYGAYIVDGAKRMQQLIQDLLHYSRVGTRDLVLVPTDCNEVLKQVLKNLQMAIAERHAIITVDSLPTVRADKLQLTQLLQNLIGNAIKFCRDDVPTVHISARMVEGQGELREQGEAGEAGEQGKLGEQFETQNISFRDASRFWNAEGYTKLKTQNFPSSALISHPSSHSSWLFSVRDNGIGIKPRYLDRIFEIFKRLHTRTEFPGTGIGLAICKKIIDRHGGNIWAESEPGAGTIFYFTLPYHDDANVRLDRDFTD